MENIHFYRLIIGAAVIGMSSLVLKFVSWVFTGSYEIKLLLPGFLLFIVVSYFMGIYVELANDFKERKMKK